MSDPPDRKLQDTRSAILATSMRLFAEHGYAGVSIRTITNALQLTPGAIYHHFASKQELYDVVIVAAFEQVMDRLAAPTAKGPARRRLHDVILRLAEFIAASPVSMRMVDRVIFEATEPLTDKVNAIVDRAHGALSAIIAEINPKVPADAYAEHLIAVVYGAQKLRPIRDHLAAPTGLGTARQLSDSLTAFTLRALRAE